MNTQQFLNHLFIGTSGYFDLTGIRDDNKRIFTRCYRLGQERPNWSQIKRANDAGWCIYYRVTTKRRRIQGQYARGTEADSYLLPALYAEMDLKDGYYPTLDAMHQAIYDFPIPPTVLIHSGGGVHILWRIKPIEITPENKLAIKEVLGGIAVALHSDPQVKDLARVLRLPGTHNKKANRNNALCEVVDCLPGELTFDDFLEYRKYAKPEKRRVQRDFPMPETPDDAKGAIIWYERNGNQPQNRNSSLYWTARAVRDNGMSMNDAMNALLPIWQSFGKDLKEGEKSIRSAYKSDAGTPGYVSKQGQARMRAGDAVSQGKAG